MKAGFNLLHGKWSLCITNEMDRIFRDLHEPWEAMRRVVLFELTDTHHLLLMILIFGKGQASDSKWMMEMDQLDRLTMGWSDPKAKKLLL